MTLGELLPWLTGSGGAIVALAFGYYLILTGKLVTGREHDRTLASNVKLESANENYIAALQSEREQKMQLMQSGQLTNQLLAGLINATAEKQGKPSPVPPALAGGGGIGP